MFASDELGKLAAADRRFLTEVTARQLRYEPLRDFPALFRIFAELDGTEDRFQYFADQFGLLGVGVSVKQDDAGGEPYSAWRLIWSEMRRIAIVLDAIEANGSAALKACFSVTSDTITTTNLPTVDYGALRGLAMFHGPAFSKSHDGPLWDLLTARRVTEGRRYRLIARCWLALLLNKWMSGYYLPEAQVFSQAVPDDDTLEGWSVRHRPSSLAGALFLQASGVVAGGVRHRQCPGCRKWFVVSTDRQIGKRSHARYCGDPKCRKVAWRLRQGMKPRARRGKEMS
jgi:hypothetical protein